MIVVDTNTIAYLTIGGSSTPLARAVFQKDPEWAAPTLWRSEYRSILALYMRKKLITIADAIRLAAGAQLLMSAREYIVESREVLQIVDESSLSAYDSEFVALALRLSVDIVTADDGILKAYPKRAHSLADFVKPRE